MASVSSVIQFPFVDPTTNKINWPMVFGFVVAVGAATFLLAKAVPAIKKAV